MMAHAWRRRRWSQARLWQKNGDCTGHTYVMQLWGVNALVSTWVPLLHVHAVHNALGPTLLRGGQSCAGTTCSGWRALRHGWQMTSKKQHRPTGSEQHSSSITSRPGPVNAKHRNFNSLQHVAANFTPHTFSRMKVSSSTPPDSSDAISAA